MRSQGANAGTGARADARRHPPGSRPSRLSNASKQLSILLEDVDLDDEPALAEALVDAVLAVARAAEHVGEEGERGRGGAVDRPPTERSEGNHDGDRPPAPGGTDRSGQTVESGGFVFVQ